MGKRFVKQLGQFIVTLFGITFLTFCLTYLAPGDPVTMLLETADTIVSQEMIDDADYDIMSIVEDEVFNQGENTELSLVAAVLKKATQADAAGFDGIKDIYNKKLKSIYKASIVVTKSMFAALDKVKDKDGRYMLQTDVASPTGYSFGGKTIYKVDDTVFGDEGDMKFFIGDVTEFVKEFDRSQVSVKWVNNDIYGQLLGLFIRLDIKKVDEEAGFFGTYTDVVA